MADGTEILHTFTFPAIVQTSNARIGALFVDADSLIKLQRVNGLDTLLSANRIIYITSEVLDEAVTMD